MAIGKLSYYTTADITPNVLRNLFSESNIVIAFRGEHRDNWNATLDLIPYAPVYYTNTSIDYQIAYQQGHGGSWQDISVLLYWDHKPVAIWPISISSKGTITEFSSHGLAVLPPLFKKGLATKTVKALVRKCMHFATALARATRIESWHSGESFGNISGLSEWHTITMAAGAVPTLQHELYLNLSPEMKTIKSGIRDSFRSLISAGTRYWDIGILTGVSPSIWEEFKTLHLAVAGKITRSTETWELQFQNISSGASFLVYLRNQMGQMVGGGFFSTSRDEGQYSVGAYDRSLFDKPLGHVVQYRAIEEMRGRGIRWYKLGARPYLSDIPIPTDKEMSISDFKQGFASHIFPRYCLRHNITERN